MGFNAYFVYLRVTQLPTATIYIFFTIEYSFSISKITKFVVVFVAKCM